LNGREPTRRQPNAQREISSAAPRTGAHRRAARHAFEQRFFANSVRAKHTSGNSRQPRVSTRWLI